MRCQRGPSSLLFTDDWLAYKPLRGEFLDHESSTTQPASTSSGDVHTNTIEGFFGNLKTGMRGTYKHVSSKWLQSYLRRVRMALLGAPQPNPDVTRSRKAAEPC